jgi:arylsulfatase A-like enzyme
MPNNSNTQRSSMNRIYLSVTLVCLLGGSLAAAQGNTAKPNVLFIVSDDLRDWLGCYGDPQARTPNLDRLAARGAVFKNAQCSAPLCNPSRTSFITGMRPSETGVYENNVVWHNAVPDAMTIPLYFKKNGYYVSGAGKITHASTVRASDWNDFGTVKGEGNLKEGGKSQTRQQVEGIKWSIMPDEKLSDLGDYQIASYIVDRLKQKRDKPFFLACGLHRPHTPWTVTEKYSDMNPLAGIKQPPIKADDLEDVPQIGRAMAATSYSDKEIRAVPQGPEKAIQGYRAAISFMDAQVGRLLDALDASPAKDNTIIVFIGDNGWNVGEKQHWAKTVLWKESTSVPLIWVAPGLTKPGSVCERPVDFLSLFPTLCELTGLSTPAQCKGPSLRPLLADPKALWDHPALTTMGRGNHAVCDDRYRYIRYSDGTEELYDHTTDPNEWTNIAKNPELAPIKARLAKAMPTLQAEAAAQGKVKGKGKGKGSGEE